VSEVELILLAGVLRALDRLRMVGAEIAKTGRVVEGSRKQARPHPLLRVEAELCSEVAKGFERLGVSGWSSGTIGSTRLGDSSPVARWESAGRRV
jgi:hypothetical protein